MRKVLWTAAPVIILLILFLVLDSVGKKERLEMWETISEETDILCQQLYEEQSEELNANLEKLFALRTEDLLQLQLVYTAADGWKAYRSDYESVAYTFKDEALEAFARSLFTSYHVQRLTVSEQRVTLTLWNDTLFYAKEAVAEQPALESLGGGWYHFSYPYEEMM